MHFNMPYVDDHRMNKGSREKERFGSDLYPALSDTYTLVTEVLMVVFALNLKLF